MRGLEAWWPMLVDTSKRFAANSQGATAIEYAIIAAGVSLAIMATVFTLGSTINTVLYGKINNAIK